MNLYEKLKAAHEAGNPVMLGHDELRLLCEVAGPVIEERRLEAEGEPFYLNEYDASRMYGGPEEGGWWYDVGDYLKCHGVFPTREAARAHLETPEMVAYVRGRQAGRHRPSSLLCYGWPVVYVEQHPGCNFPRERPRYE